MPDLIAIDMPPGTAFVDAMTQAWGHGNAVLPVDPRLPASARDHLLDAMAPARVISPEGVTNRDGIPVERGDALVMATSGSTGLARGVVLTHSALAAAAEATSQRLEVDPEADRWVACLPLSHMGGLGVVTRALHTETPYEVFAFQPSRVMEAGRLRGATLVSLVATQLNRLDVSAFRRVLLGGGPRPPSVPANVTVTYGMTETGGGVVYDGFPLDGVEVRISHDEVYIRGPMLLRAYRDGTSPVDDDGWLATGDLGSIDDTGRLVVAGRKSDLIISGGENVWPGPVEARLREHPAVRDVAVIGRPSPEWGEMVVAVVVPAPGAAVPELAELRSFVTETLPPFAAPRALEYLDHLPRTTLGKLRRADL